MEAELKSKHAYSREKIGSIFGMSGTAFKRVVEGKSSPGLDKVVKAKTKLTDLNVDWLVTGRGYMWETPPTDKSVTLVRESEASSYEIQALKQKVYKLEERIEKLEKSGRGN